MGWVDLLKSQSLAITKRSEDHPFFQRELAPGSGLIFRSGFMREPCLADALSHVREGDILEPIAFQFER
jgi:hypothetical protein